ncbi:MAG: hypothetical protein EBS37_07820 [Betaproteobacteria bacterium]|nr:hypothetical protein [Betaproteobacteria bacterium]
MNARLPQPVIEALTVSTRRQKPLIGASLLERLLLRHVSVVCPESRLVVAVIKQAFVDLCSPSKHQRAEARRFFQDGRLDLWCDQVGLSPNFMREIAIKAGYLNPADTAEGDGHA